ncbi:hypothetical protein AAU57_07510 [Nonlabens sp. YIK11]|uniref:hypothetical protein n=1 Tax=Nonlabens sp. YIK11 TaxID=1453349 RepID=UPI0006DC0364|nr:hypothetical protein [Nonlabens sp. YIK11]KQC33175.1 hypothetical protein AAU57_07510 [Nonlabens sp. YIK11]
MRESSLTILSSDFSKTLKFLTGLLLITFTTGCGIQQANKQLNPQNKIVGNPADNLRYDYAGTFNQEDLQFLKDTFRWTQDVLVINYNLSDDNCAIPYNKPTDPKTRYDRARNYWDSFYSDIDLMGAKVVHVEASERYGKAFGSYSNRYYWDEKGFLLDHFFNNARECENVLVVNKEGKFYQENRSYSQQQVAFYIAKLKDQIPNYELE